MKTECIIWQGRKDQFGYGRIGKRSLKAHRVAFELATGKDPTGWLVCHHCDNPSCINPEHLYLGTHQDNANDKVKRNRCSRLKGEINPAATMTDDLATKVIKEPGTYRGVARKFGLQPNAVRNVKLGITWQDLDRSEVKTSGIQRKLTIEQAIAIKSDTRSCNVLAREHGVSQRTIIKIRKGITFKDAG